MNGIATSSFLDPGSGIETGAASFAGAASMAILLGKLEAYLDVCLFLAIGSWAVTSLANFCRAEADRTKTRLARLLPYPDQLSSATLGAVLLAITCIGPSMYMVLSGEGQLLPVFALLLSSTALVFALFSHLSAFLSVLSSWLLAMS